MIIFESCFFMILIKKNLNNPWRGAEAWHFYCLAINYTKANTIRHYEQPFNRIRIRIGYKKSLFSFSPSLLLQLQFQNLFLIIRKTRKHGAKLRGRKRNLRGYGFRYDIPLNSPSDSKFEKFPCPGKTCSSTVTLITIRIVIFVDQIFSPVLSGNSILKKEYYTCKMCRHKMLD